MSRPKVRSECEPVPEIGRTSVAASILTLSKNILAVDLFFPVLGS